MTEDEPVFEGYIQLHYGYGVVPISIYKTAGQVDVSINGEWADDVDGKTYLADEYGDRFYRTLDDYKEDEWLAIEEVWPE